MDRGKTRNPPVPCPFCGGTEIITFGSDQTPGHDAALCVACEAEGPEAAGEDAALALWNRRVTVVGPHHG